jgi:poly(beta-D-mannuronate) lyase
LQFNGLQGGFSFFSIENGGELRLQGLRLNGLSPNAVAESFIRTSPQPMLEHYKLFVDACDFTEITDGRKHAFKANKGSFADTIQFTNCRFEDISGEVISIAAEKEDRGVYNAEVVIFRNCFFRKILVGAIDLYRGGNDESTTGPYFYMDHCTFVETGNVELCAVVRLFGVQYSGITNSLFFNSGRAGRSVLYEDFGWTRHRFSHNNRFRAGTIVSVYPRIIRSPDWRIDPLLINEEQGDYRLGPGSPLRGKGSDKKDIGALWKDGQLDYD